MSQTAPPSIGFPDDELLFQDLSRHSNVSTTTLDLDNEPTSNQAALASPSLLPVSTKIRQAVRQAVQDVHWANDVQQSYRELKRSQRKVIRSKLLMGSSLGLEMSERCVLCTLPLGTCEHYKPVYQHHQHQGTAPQRSIMKRQYHQQQQPSHKTVTKGSGTSNIYSLTITTPYITPSITHSLIHSLPSSPSLSLTLSYCHPSSPCLLRARRFRPGLPDRHGPRPPGLRSAHTTRHHPPRRPPAEPPPPADRGSRPRPGGWG